MGSINPQIDAAVPLMKARAAKFDDWKSVPTTCIRTVEQYEWYIHNANAKKYSEDS